MNRLKRITGENRNFYQELRSLVLPIVIQNLITTSVTMADVLMLGRLSQTALSAASLAGQVMFLLSMLQFGLNSGITILASQYWGKGDRNTISSIFGIGLLISLATSLAASLAALIAPAAVMSIWTDVPQLQEEGAAYLRIAAVSYLFFGISQPYLAAMKSCSRVRLSMRVSVIALGLNVFLNYLLIFGAAGLPAMGIRGAALATAIARGIELLICIVDSRVQNCFPADSEHIFHIPNELIADFAHYSLPALVNDMLWAFAYNMNSVIMGHLGSDIVAANSVVTVARDLITTVGFGISAASSIMLGKLIGAGKKELAKKTAERIFRLTFLVSLLQGTVLFAVRPLVPQFVNLSRTASGYLMTMLAISCIYQVGQVMNTLLIASFFRCGGDSKFGLKLDLFGMWAVSVPLSLIGAFLLKLPPIQVYCLMCLDEAVKLPFALYYYYRGGWIRDLTREFA